MIQLLTLLGYALMLGGALSGLRSLREAEAGPALGRLFFGLMFVGLGWYLSRLGV